MTTKKHTASSVDIRGQLNAIDAVLDGLEHEAAGLALGAVSGDPEAVTRLSVIRAEIARTNEDRKLLEFAHQGACNVEAAAIRDAKDADKAAALKAAKAQAREIVKVCDRLTWLTKEMAHLFQHLNETEKAAATNLHVAEYAGNGNMYRRGLSINAVENVREWQKGGQLTPAPVGLLARKGWADLLTDEEA